MIPYIDEVIKDFPYKKEELVTPYFLDVIIYKYIHSFYIINKVEKMICFVHDDIKEFNKSEKLLKWLNNPNIFIASNNENKCINFHITHEKEISSLEKEILLKYLKNIYSISTNYQIYNDEYCKYSITFTIYI